MTPKTKAFIKVFSAIFIWSLLGPVLNLSPLTSFQNVWFGGLLATIILLTYGLRYGKLGEVKKIEINVPFVLFLLTSGVSGVLWLYSLTVIPIATAVLLYSTVPIWTYVLSMIFLSEKPKKVTAVAILLGFLGIFIIVSGRFGSFGGALPFLGTIAVLSASLLNAGQAVILKKFSISYPTWILVILITTSQTLIAMPFIFSDLILNIFALVGILFLAVFSSIIAFFLYVDSFKLLRASSVTLVTYAEPFLAAIWGLLWLNQGLSSITLLGGILIIVSGYLTVKGEEV